MFVSAATLLQNGVLGVWQQCIPYCSRNIELKNEMDCMSHGITVSAWTTNHDSLVANSQSLEPVDNGPLNWCQANEHRFPRMSKLARRHLWIPATSVAPECVFSRPVSHSACHLRLGLGNLRLASRAEP